MLKIISLIENTCENEELKCEHGLSLYIEKGDKKYLLDTGATGDFIDNANTLGIDLKDLDAVFMSHNHYDHIGGLEKLLSLNTKVKVYINSEAKNKFYAKVGIIKKYIGEREGLFEDYKDRFIWIDKPLKIHEDFYMMSNEVKDKEFFCKDKRLSKLEDGKLVQDDFRHEMFLVIVEKDEIVIVSSCSHSGVVNITATVKNNFPNKAIKYFIGGFHMKGITGPYSINCSEGYIDSVIEKMEEFQVERIYTCHCTGLKAYNYMKKAMGEKMQYFSTGDELIIK